MADEDRGGTFVMLHVTAVLLSRLCSSNVLADLPSFLSFRVDRTKPCTFRLTGLNFYSFWRIGLNFNPFVFELTRLNF